ncbi:hypothetical protein AaE_011176 [Aphanomyces astaci]|uniref:Uncharacterized protein n=1 Tax=Aphanomyces astaci TaxID=112090 RepID=A0A6A4ZL71_APHAT|nr:hypothetical protein AaE_011176 [Aphanomyces astaci]
MPMSARSPTKPGYPIGKVAFIEGYRNVNGRIHGPRSPAADAAYSTSHRFPPGQHVQGGDDGDTKQLSTVASASGIDPRLVRLYSEIETCVREIEAIRQHLASMPVDDHASDVP